MYNARLLVIFLWSDKTHAFWSAVHSTHVFMWNYIPELEKKITSSTT